MRRRIVSVALAFGLVVGLAGSMVTVTPVAAQCGPACEPGGGNGGGGNGGGDSDSIATIILSDPGQYRVDVYDDLQDFAGKLRNRFLPAR